MPIYVVVTKVKVDEVEQRIEALGEDRHYCLAPNVWLVDFDGTTQGVAEAVGIRGPKGPGDSVGIAFSIGLWSGTFAPDVWEWLSTHVGRKAG